MRGWTMIVAAVVLVQLFAGGDAKGECCLPKPGWSNGQVTLNCNDCKAGTPYCGVGRCNMWGCNCDGGCRKGTCGGFFSAPQIYDVVDSDHDGRISHAEAHEYLTASGVHNIPHMLTSAPTAGDDHHGYLPDDVITADDHKYDMCAAFHAPTPETAA